MTWVHVPAAIAQRTWKKTWRRPVALTFSLVQPLMWLVLFGFLFDRYRVVDLPPGARYLDFLLPGVCGMTALFGASQSGIELIRDLQTGFLARLLWTPAPRALLLVGKIGADVVRLLAQATVVLLLGAALGARIEAPRLGSGAVALAALALFGIAFASVSVCVASVARSPEGMAAFVHVVNAPMLFTSTALVPSRQMPPALEAVARHNPLSLAVDAGRAAVLGGHVSAAATLLPLAALAALLFALATQLLGRATRG